MIGFKSAGKQHEPDVYFTHYRPYTISQKVILAGKALPALAGQACYSGFVRVPLEATHLHALPDAPQHELTLLAFTVLCAS